MTLNGAIGVIRHSKTTLNPFVSRALLIALILCQVGLIIALIWSFKRNLDIAKARKLPSVDDTYTRPNAIKNPDSAPNHT